MATRKKHITTPYEKARKKHREVTSRHVLVVEAQIKDDDKRKLFHIADELRFYGNHLTNIAKKRLDQLFRTKAYREALQRYKNTKVLLNALEKDSAEYAAAKKKVKAAADKLANLQKQYKITFDDLCHDMIKISAKSNALAVFLLSKTEDVWSAAQSILYGSGKQLHYANRGDLPIIRAKQIERGITMSFVNGVAQCRMRDIEPFTIVPKENDFFAKNELACIEKFLSDPKTEENAVTTYLKSGIPQDTYRPCYIALKCKTIRGKLRVYAHITIEGHPLPKYTKSGKLKHPCGKGPIGVDLGTQSVAVVSDSEAILVNLAERNNKTTKLRENKERRIQRYLDRSRRANNKDRYNENGTVKKGIRKRWKKSKRYRASEAYLKEIRRKNAASRKCANNELANTIRTMGDDLTIEKANFKALQKKAKPSTPEKEEKPKRRKRFGHSIQNRCPGHLYAQLRYKFGENHFHVVSDSYRASQYDHKNDTYIKKKLRQRWHSFDDGTKVQRDIYKMYGRGPRPISKIGRG